MNINNHIISIEEPFSVYAEAYRKLEININYSLIDKKSKVIAITSSKIGEGKTTTAINLAAVLSQKKRKVVVVDLDLYKPKLHLLFGLDNKIGFADVIAKHASLNDAIVKLDYGFDVLTIGNSASIFSSSIESDNCKEVIESLAKMYEYVLIDCPPVLLIADTVTLTRYSDGVVFVVNKKISKRTDCKSAMSSLHLAKVNVLGAFLTRCDIKVNKHTRNYLPNKDGGLINGKPER